MSLYHSTVPVYVKMLQNADRWIEKAIALAEQKKFDPEVFFSARLAPDQFAFSRQIQGACDTAKYAAAKLSGTEPPAHPDTEKTLAELRARIATCVAYLESFEPAQFAGAEERACSHVWMAGKSIQGADYVAHYAMPNFLFHLTTAYAILRHNGVDVGKRDYLGSLPLQG